MTLNDFEFKSSYNKLDNDIAKEFYIPCMQSAISYDRITGYFSSSIYAIAWEALKEFIAKDGKIRIICSPFISEDDAVALLGGHQAKKDEVVQRALMSELNRMIQSSYLEDPAKLLACLICNGTISIKLAIKIDETHPTVQKLFHDKAGVFYDSEGNRVGFRGSLNETYNGLSNDGNIESVDVFQSWEGGKEALRVNDIADYFNRVWNEEIEHIYLSDLPPQIKEKLKEITQNCDWVNLLDSINQKIKKTYSWLPSPRATFRPHQLTALQSWVANKRCGLFEHATGSGKTFTAICAIRDAIIRKKSVLVLVPSLGLLKQWEVELKKTIQDVDCKYLLCDSKHKKWKEGDVLKSWTSFLPGNNTIVLATMDTAASNHFITRIEQGEHLLIVVDEAHRIGSPKRRKCLSINAGERLGLSATPIRYGDPEGTQAIMDYFCGIVNPVYTLQNAIQDGVLTKYFYYPKTTILSIDEQHRWNEITKSINRLYAQLMSSSDATKKTLTKRMNQLLIKRARIVKNSVNKLEVAKKLICTNYQKGQRWIVYCDNKQQLQQLLEILTQHEIDAYEYHSEMQGDKDATLKYFSLCGGVLVSIKCLDEGIDIPATTHALILASSKNPREFIQRRGRILRKSKGKNLARLYDVLVTPNGELEDELKNLSIIEAELARAIQFGEWAANPSCVEDLRCIAIDYGIDLKRSLNFGIEGDRE